VQLLVEGLKVASPSLGQLVVCVLRCPFSDPRSDETREIDDEQHDHDFVEQRPGSAVTRFTVKTAIPVLLLLPRRGSGHGSLESIAYRAHSARTAEPVHLAANA
jgi:hypothetical protein